MMSEDGHKDLAQQRVIVLKVHLRKASYGVGWAMMQVLQVGMQAFVGDGAGAMMPVRSC